MSFAVLRIKEEPNADTVSLELKSRQFPCVSCITGTCQLHTKGILAFCVELLCTQRAEVTLSANARSWPWFPCLELYKENGRGLSNTAACTQGSALGSGGQTEERQQIGESRGFKKKKQRFEITSRLDVKRERLALIVESLSP